MRQFHVVCGLPRSGSTLLCSLLNQNPRFFASSTSPVCNTLANLGHILSTSPEVKSDLHAEREVTEKKIRETMRGVVRGWYSQTKAPVVFDKGRGWGHHAALLLDLFPKAKLIVCVRDLRDVFASIEKRNAEFPALSDAPDPIAKTVFARADTMFAPNGMIGMPINGIEDLLRRNVKQKIVVQFEQLVSAPEDTMRRLYSELGEKWHRHNFRNVQGTATDLDELYLNKFPHSISGPVVKPSPKERDRWVPSDVETAIMDRYPGYNQAFGYTKG